MTKSIMAAKALNDAQNIVGNRSVMCAEHGDYASANLWRNIAVDLIDLQRRAADIMAHEKAAA